MIINHIWTVDFSVTSNFYGLEEQIIKKAFTNHVQGGNAALDSVNELDGLLISLHLIHVCDHVFHGLIGVVERCLVNNVRCVFDQTLLCNEVGEVEDTT